MPCPRAGRNRQEIGHNFSIYKIMIYVLSYDCFYDVNDDCIINFMLTSTHKNINIIET